MESVTIVESYETLSFVDGEETIVIQQPRETVQFQEQGILIVQVPFVFVPFHFVATEGQIDFVLDSSPLSNGVLSFMVNGIGQSQAKGDFSVEGATITVDAMLQEGDEVAGVYAQAI